MTSNHMARPVALITGASRGLGLALAEALAADGWDLVLTARDGAALAAATAALDPAARVDRLAGDVTDPGHRAALVAHVAAIGGLDALVNNAGALGPSPLPAVAEVAPGDLRAVLETNVVAPVALVGALAPHLRPGARVVSVTSDAAVEAYPGWGAYAASKAALEAATRVLAAERPGWKVYAVDPGDMRTAMHQAAFPGEDISDRPLPAARVPGILRLLHDDLRSGRYQAADLAARGACGEAAGGKAVAV
jgi:NAD(P)-dependent dehydrogenase (short-subunit alcohol dehydrogenase family)